MVKCVVINETVIIIIIIIIIIINRTPQSMIINKEYAC